MVTEQATYFYGTGRRKTSIARVRLYPGNGQIIINGRPLEDVFPRVVWQVQATQPLRVAEQTGHFNVVAKIEGGGISGWAGALAHGISRALIAADQGLRPTLKRQGLLTRDSRVKERKKYGLKRARKAPQYTKR